MMSLHPIAFCIVSFPIKLFSCICFSISVERQWNKDKIETETRLIKTKSPYTKVNDKSFAVSSAISTCEKDNSERTLEAY